MTKDKKWNKESMAKCKKWKKESMAKCKKCKRSFEYDSEGEKIL